MRRDSAVNRFGRRRDICLSSWADAATGCAILGSNRQANGTRRQAIGTHRQAARTRWQTIGRNWQTAASIRELFHWDSAIANTRARTVNHFHCDLLSLYGRSKQLWTRRHLYKPIALTNSEIVYRRIF